MTDQAQTGERVYKGIPVSAGIGQGKAFVLHKAQTHVPHYDVAEAELPQQIQRFHEALVLTRHQIQEVQHKVSQALNAHEASIFDAHLLVLDDPTLIDSVTSLIASKKINVEAAFQEFVQKYTATLSAIDDAYLRERVADMRDVTSRIMNNLLGNLQHEALKDLKEPCIIIADDLSPSEVAVINRKVVLGFGTDVGSKTSHTAIMARSLQLPAVVGLKDVSVKIKSGAHILLDGYNGSVVLNPTDQTLFEYGRLVAQQASIEEKLRAIQSLDAITLDGQKITLSANIEKSGDIEAVKEFGAEGVGLFRTEYLFINRDTLPTEDECLTFTAEHIWTTREHISIALRECSARLQRDTQRLEIPIAHNTNKCFRMMVLVVNLSLSPDLPTSVAVERKHLAYPGGRNAWD